MSAAYRETVERHVFSAAREQAATMEAFLESEAAQASTHTELEEYIRREGREYERRLLQAHLELRGAKERRLCEVRGADGAVRGYARAGQRRPLTSIFGSVDAVRLAYQREELESLHPLDASLNLPEGVHSHGIQRLVAEHAARSSFEETRTIVVQWTSAVLGKRQVEELAVRAARDFDSFYRQRAVEAEQTEDLVVITTDGKGINMRHEDLRPATKKAAEAARTRRKKKRQTKGEKRNRKRMAQVAAIYTLRAQARTPLDIIRELRPARDTAAPRPRPTNKRVFATIADSAKEAVWAAFEEGLRRDPEKRRRWVVTVDGNPDQLKLVKWAAKKAGVKITIVIDVMHVLEYLWKAAYCFHAEGSQEAEQWVEQRLMWLLEGRSGGDLAKGMRRLADARQLSASARKPLEKCAAYLVKYTRLMHYDRALADGLPIATGVVEGACRYLVADRMDRTGARWSLDGAEAVLRLRSLMASGDFDAYWHYHLEQEHFRNHASRYINKQPPNPLLPQKPALRLVK